MLTSHIPKGPEERIRGVEGSCWPMESRKREMAPGRTMFCRIEDSKRSQTPSCQWSALVSHTFEKTR
ncbi:hypothetical protein BDA96_02G078600 [Sorghum bicolor]|uniref:Uncharacterized protein n=1 Tax=Sorghum bicolor TaxID=4558 RepID=A0A921RKT6_SORBI|nr:hypothetical protein BDA96_02G078600 [Sorghum bicolor]